jgi:hypothetical protein
MQLLLLMLITHSLGNKFLETLFLELSTHVTFQKNLLSPTLLQSRGRRQLVCLKYWHIPTKLHSVFVKSQLYVVLMSGVFL